MRVAVKGRQVVITPVAADPLTLAQRLALYDAARHGGEVMAVQLDGAERW